MGDPRSAGNTRFLSRWLPVILWAAVIFTFSTDLFSDSNTSSAMSPFLRWLFPHLPAEILGAAHYFVRKFSHFAAYFIFAVLLMRALHRDDSGGLTKRRALIALGVIVIYAGIDEFHQSFVPSRGASIGDVLLDAMGGLCGIYFFHWLNSITSQRWH